MMKYDGSMNLKKCTVAITTKKNMLILMYNSACITIPKTVAQSEKV